MNTRKILVSIVIAVSLPACAHGDGRTVLARSLVGAGAAALVVGGLVAAGCVDDTGGGGCSGGPDQADLAAGIPVMAVGAGLVAGGLLAKPKDGPRRLLQPPNPVPTPQQ